MILRTRNLSNPELFGRIIKGWYLENKRDLPWRSTRDPFKIWLSEIILQQTRVDQGLNYYKKFINEFETVSSLADATEQKILMFWQGLGYYSRARNLHFTAKHIAKNLNGNFPSSYEELLKLKGVGHYTAAAIASFSFGEKVAVLDGNVFRVLARFLGVELPINSSEGVKTFKEISERMLPESDVSTYNQGIMEFGALQCIPVNPNCEICVLNHDCEAYLLNRVKDLPVKLKKTKVKELYLHFFAITSEEKVVLTQRNKKGIWQNLWEFPNLEYSESTDTGEAFEDFVSKSEIKDLKLIKSSTVYKHLLSHRRIFAQFHHIKSEVAIGNELGQSIRFSDIQEFPIHRLMDRFLEENPGFMTE